MPDKKGDSEIVIPTYQGMEIVSAKNEVKIKIMSTNGTMTIRCYQHHSEKDLDEIRKSGL